MTTQDGGNPAQSYLDKVERHESDRRHGRGFAGGRSAPRVGPTHGPPQIGGVAAPAIPGALLVIQTPGAAARAMLTAWAPSIPTLWRQFGPCLGGRERAHQRIRRQHLRGGRGGATHTYASGATAYHPPAYGGYGYPGYHPPVYGGYGYSVYHPPDRGTETIRPPDVTAVPAAGAIVGATVGPAAASANTAAAYSSGDAAGSAAGYAMGVNYAALPTGCAYQAGPNQYLCGGSWFRPAYGANGLYYTVLPAP